MRSAQPGVSSSSPVTDLGGLCFLKMEETFLHEGFPKLHELLEKNILKDRNPIRCSPSFLKNGRKIHVTSSEPFPGSHLAAFRMLRK